MLQFERLWVDISTKAVTNGEWGRGPSPKSHMLSLEPQESSIPSKLSGMQTVTPVALSWLKGKRLNSARNQKGIFFLYFQRGKHYFILIPLWTRTPSSLILDQNYINTKNQVIKGERRILKELGFCVHVKHPHKVSLSHTRNYLSTMQVQPAFTN